MKTKAIPLFAFTCILHLAASASPFAPDDLPLECVVYSYGETPGSLHVETIETNLSVRPKHWTFPASFAGHRAVCRLPGAATNEIFQAWIGGDRFKPGDPFGVSSVRDIPQIELTEVSPIFARVNLYDGTDDRLVHIGPESGDIEGASFTNFYPDAIWCRATNLYEHVRIVPYAVAGTKSGGDEFFQLAQIGITNRVVAEFDVSRTTKPIVTEADFIRDGVYDIDLDGFVVSILNNGNVRDAVGDVTAVKYRLVFGKEGPVGRESNLDTTTVVRAFSTLVERRYEPLNARTLPTQLACDAIQHVARPTFRWRLDEPGTVKGYASSSSLFGCSYTAFQIEIADAATGTVVYDSGLVRTPAKNAKGEFVWTAPVSAGDQTALGRLYAKTGNWKWRVAMYNAKFQPMPAVLASENGWSAYAYFSTTSESQSQQ